MHSIFLPVSCSLEFTTSAPAAEQTGRWISGYGLGGVYINSLITPGNPNAVQVSYATAYYTRARTCIPPSLIMSGPKPGRISAFHTDADPRPANGNIFQAIHSPRSFNTAGVSCERTYQEDVEFSSSPTKQRLGVELHSHEPLLRHRPVQLRPSSTTRWRFSRTPSAKRVSAGAILWRTSTTTRSRNTTGSRPINSTTPISALQRRVHLSGRCISPATRPHRARGQTSFPRSFHKSWLRRPIKTTARSSSGGMKPKAVTALTGRFPRS